MNSHLIFYYHKLNQNSFRALAGAIETEKSLADLPVSFPNNEKELKQILKQNYNNKKKIILGFSLVSAQMLEIKSLITYLKINFPKIISVVGGPHPSKDPGGTLNLGFDIVVIGEGEKSFLELLKKIKLGQNWQKIKGLAFFQNKKLTFTGQSQPINLNKYPPLSLKFKKFGPIEISRGCPWGCKYCQVSYLFGRKMRHRSIKQIIKYVKLSLEYGFKDIRFITPNALSYGSSGKKPNILALENLLKLLKKIVKNRGRIFLGTFPSEVRPDFVNRKTLKIIRTYTDNNNLIIGAQTGSPRMLKKINRGHTLEDIYRAVKLTKKFKLLPNIDFIFGLPEETLTDQYQTLKVIEDLILIGARIHAHWFMPLVGTPFENKKPSLLNPEIRKKLNYWESQGKLYGSWKKQELISQANSNL